MSVSIYFVKSSVGKITVYIITQKKNLVLQLNMLQVHA